MFGNMTDWGPLAEKFLVGPVANSYDVIGFAEHHIPPQNFIDFIPSAKPLPGENLLLAPGKQ